jgi:hypothetical protein
VQRPASASDGTGDRAQGTDMSDKNQRKHERRDVELRGVLKLEEHVAAPAVACEVKNLSLGGAKIKATAVSETTRSVVLEIERFVEHPAKFAWVSHPYFGLKFLDTPEPTLH